MEFRIENNFFDVESQSFYAGKIDLIIDCQHFFNCHRIFFSDIILFRLFTNS